MKTFSASKTPRRIAVLRALYLGDLLCAVPALNALDRRFPDAEITLIGLPWAWELAERLPAIDRFVEFAGYPGLPEVAHDEQRTAALLDACRGERYDLAIQLHGSGEVSNELAAAFAAGATLGFGPLGDDRLSVTLPWREDENEIVRWLRLVGELGADTADARIDVPIAVNERLAAGLLLHERRSRGAPLVGIHCGSKLPSRRWPVERFAALADELCRRYDARIVLTGGEGERHLAAEMRARMSTSPIDLVGRTELGAFLALVECLDLLVTNDTGASHVAAATRTPSVVLFGPSRPSRWAPLDRSLHTVIDAREHIGIEWSEEEYLAHLPLAPVLAACEQMLGGSNARDRRQGAGSLVATEGRA